MVITDFDELYGFEIPDGWTVEKLEPKVGNVKSGKRLLCSRYTYESSIYPCNRYETGICRYK